MCAEGNIIFFLFIYCIAILQAIEFFFFACCIGAVAILFTVMAFFYKYVDLSQEGAVGNGTGSEAESDETRALILSDSTKKEEEPYTTNHMDDKGNESEF